MTKAQTDHSLKNGNSTSGTHESCWFDSSLPALKLQSLKEHAETDVVIVGGGLAGLTTAYCLACKGLKVVVVEDGNIGSGETGRTTAQLVTALDDRYYHLASLFGEKNTKLIADSHKKAIDFVEKTIAKEHIDCNFERLNGYLFLHPSDDRNSLRKEFEAATNADVRVEELDKVPGLMTEEGKCICFPDQAQFHPIKYLYGLCKAIEKKGGRIYTRTHASKIDETGIVTRKGCKVKAKHIVIATNSPVNNKYGIDLKQNGYRTYVIASLIEKGSVLKALWWDTGDKEVNHSVPPYHYVRIMDYNDKYDLLISGGENHPVGDTEIGNVPEEKRYKALEKWTRERFPIDGIVFQWSGQGMETMDSLAYIGRNVWDSENVYVITGDSGNGMTHCTIGGMLITDLITGKENKWEDIYRPSRFNLKASLPYFKDFMMGYISYLKSKPKDGDAIKLSSIKKDEARILELRGEKCGAYKDTDGHLHIVSAECTHLKCIVKWNNDEKSWDCPCHGSRFTYDGKVINGPANSDLPACSEKAVEQEVEKSRHHK